MENNINRSSKLSRLYAKCELYSNYAPIESLEKLIRIKVNLKKKSNYSL